MSIPWLKYPSHILFLSSINVDQIEFDLMPLVFDLSYLSELISPSLFRINRPSFSVPQKREPS